MLPPLPSNLITLPACKSCNNGFSFDENVIRALLAAVGTHPRLVEERSPGEWLERTLELSPKIRAILELAKQADGSYQTSGQLLESFTKVFFKTSQGLFYGLYDRVVAAEDLLLLRVEDQRQTKPEEVIIQLRPNPLIDITDSPLSELSPHSWHTREPVYFMNLVDPATGKTSQRIFRLVRDTPVEWVRFQSDTFGAAFVKCDGDRCACVIDLWNTLVVAVSAPWPDGRGPLRRGRKNPMSRDKKIR